MQKTITLRASDDDLNDVIEKFKSYGWKVVSTTRNTEMRKIGSSYGWTIVLEVDDDKFNAQEFEQRVEQIKKRFARKSYIMVALTVIVVIVAGVLGIIFA